MPSEIDVRLLRKRLESALADVDANLLELEQSRQRLAATLKERTEPRPKQTLLQELAFARLQARLASLPVIEQAKGILIARSGCQPDEAFDILRRASQRTNVKLRELAADIVRRTIAGEHRPSGTAPWAATAPSHPDKKDKLAGSAALGHDSKLPNPPR